MAKVFSRKKKIKSGGGNEEILRAQAERIDELKRELEKATAEAERLKKREEGVADAIMFALEKAREYETEARVRFELETERLETFRKRWTKLARSPETDRKLKECLSDMKKDTRRGF
jgi:hypothetical protein